MAGTSGDPQNVILFRYTQRGRPDATFGTGGIVDSPVGPGASSAYGLRLLPDGRIIATGFSTANASNAILMARFASNGTLERWSRTSFPGLTSSTGFGLAVQGDGKILALGNASPPTYINGIPSGSEVLRFNDSNFGAGPIDMLNDFDGDGRTDLSIYRPDHTGIELSLWAVQTMRGTEMETYFGTGEDLPVPQDYDGDGKTDVAVFRPSNGTWYYKTDLYAEDFTAVQFGQTGDIPIPNDYDGDGRADLVVFRPSVGNWYIRNSSDGSVTTKQFGASGRTPVTGDFDGDGKADLAYFEPTTSGYTIQRSSDGLLMYRGGGAIGATPLVADYDGDRISDAGYFTLTGGWRYTRSYDNQTVITSFGMQGDIPVPADYSGDGLADLGVFRPSEGNWYVTSPANNSFTTQFGQSGDTPLPGR